MTNPKVYVTIYFHYDSVGLRAMHINPFIRSYEEGIKTAKVYKYGNKTNPPYTNYRGYMVKRYI